MHTSRPLTTAGILLGIGLGGFFDGILFHQILQIHNMLSAKLPKTSIPNIEINMFWDGLFHAFTWITTVFGLALLFRTARRRESPLSTRVFVGAMWGGWGLFNLVEGIIDHLILKLHHVHENGDHLLWDLLFLGSGVLFMTIGWLLGRRPEVAATSRAAA